MSKKYSYELKLKIVEEYLEGPLGYGLLARKYNVSHHALIAKWVNQYTELGKQGLQRKKIYEKYPLNLIAGCLKIQTRHRGLL